MNPSPLSRFLSELRRAVQESPSGAPPGTATVRFAADPAPDGGFLFRPARSDEPLAHVLTFPLDRETRERRPPVAGVAAGDSLGRQAAGEAAAGGDAGIVRRRLEMVLGGPPGFATGARAEILADLLVEFGRSTLVAEIRRDWISQFDTGADSSESVSKVPPPRGVAGIGAVAKCGDSSIMSP